VYEFAPSVAATENTFVLANAVSTLEIYKILGLIMRQPPLGPDTVKVVEHVTEKIVLNEIPI
jgi:Holliday junction resolvasome RuvABC endonuclease subunit